MAKPKATKAPKAAPAPKEIPVKAAASDVRPTAKTKTVDSAAFGKTNKLATPLRERPLSPHLQVYRPQISSVLSIMHRGTGVVLYIGAFVLAALLLALTYGVEVFGQAVAYINHPAGQLAVLGFTFCLFYHLLNGIRHLCWDAGKGFGIKAMTLSGWFVFITSILLTGGAWALTHPDCLAQCLGKLGL